MKNYDSVCVVHRNGDIHEITYEEVAMHMASPEKDWWCIVFFLWHKCHRLDGPAVIRSTGSKEWYVNGMLHREDGPAVEMISGTKEWYVNGVRHRLDGPAVELMDGSKEYWVDDRLCVTWQAYLQAANAYIAKQEYSRDMAQYAL